ncbi:MAG: SH3 domain-containing protein [Lachnospiraceae bacterium]|nr:SH3 domain-containing protein [Lachnospiraceae bacterium]
MRRLIPVLVGAAAIIILAIGFVRTLYKERYTPTNDPADYNEIMGLKDGEYTIMINGTILGDVAVEADGSVYIPRAVASKYINSRFYFDEGAGTLIYTNSSESRIFEADKAYYTVDGVQTGTDRPVLKIIGSGYYIDSAYLKIYTKCDLDTYTEPNRMVIRTKWGSEEAVVVTAEETAVRYQGGIKSPVFTTVTKDTELTALDTIDDWTRVITKDGFDGYVHNDDISQRYVRELEEPAAPDETFSHILRDHKICMAWHQVMSEYASYNISTDIAYVKGVNVISPTWYSFDGDKGEIRSISTAEYVRIAHNAGMEVWALFSNEFDGVFDGGRSCEVLADSERRQKIITALIDDVVSVGADGINLDFEGLPEAQIGNFLQFVRELSVECEKHSLVLSVDIYVPTYTKYYNRTELKNYADYIVIMAYDEHTTGSPQPGPTADVPFVEQGIQDTLEEVPKEQIINGIPFYTPVWATSASGEFTLAGNYDMVTARGFLDSHGAEVRYQESLGINYGTYDSEIDGNTYQIWLSDNTSVDSFMKLIKEYDLAGVSCWKLGMESGTEIWETIMTYTGIVDED